MLIHLMSDIVRRIAGGSADTIPHQGNPFSGQRTHYCGSYSYSSSLS